jgi:hypothetical protein
MKHVAYGKHVTYGQRKTHWCSWGRGGPDPCRRRKDLVTAVDEHGAVLRTAEGWSRSYCPVHLESGTLEMRAIAARAKPAVKPPNPALINALILVTDLPADIVYGTSRIGHVPRSHRTWNRWFTWLYVYPVLGLVGFSWLVALKQHFFGP